MKGEAVCNFSFVYRLILGYAYPAYECFKTVELNKPDIEQLLFWCQYWYAPVTCQLNHYASLLTFCEFSSSKKPFLWYILRILVAALTVFERVGDSFISWYGGSTRFWCMVVLLSGNFSFKCWILFLFLKVTYVWRSKVGILRVSLVPKNKGITHFGNFIVLSSEQYNLGVHSFMFREQHMFMKLSFDHMSQSMRMT